MASATLTKPTSGRNRPAVVRTTGSRLSGSRATTVPAAVRTIAGPAMSAAKARIEGHGQGMQGEGSLGGRIVTDRIINVKRGTAKTIATKISTAVDIRPSVRARGAKAAGKAAAGPVPRRLRRRVEALIDENYAFMDSPIFKQRGIEASLFSFEGGQEPALPRTSWYQPTRDDALDPAIVGAPQLMKAPEEKLMFLRFNYCKRKLVRLVVRIKREGLSRELGEQFVHWHERFEHFREYLVRTNLALVLAMAKRTRLGDVDFAEVVSEGNMALLRAVDKFNVDRGFKFSTYACRAILKAFSRTAQKHTRHRTRFPVEFEPEMEKSDWQDRRRDAVESDCIDELKQIVDRNLADLSNVEQTVIRRRFNWEQTQETPLTLEEVGKIIGVTKERVRQIQNKAMTKIRLLMEEGVLRTKPHVDVEPAPDAPASTAAEAATTLPDAAVSGPRVEALHADEKPAV